MHPGIGKLGKYYPNVRLGLANTLFSICSMDDVGDGFQSGLIHQTGSQI